MSDEALPMDFSGFVFDDGAVCRTAIVFTRHILFVVGC